MSEPARGGVVRGPLTDRAAAGDRSAGSTLRAVFLSFGAALLAAVVAMEYGPVAAGRIPFPAEIVVRFPVWEGVRPVLPRVRHPEQGDIATQFFPWRVHVVEQLHQWRFPLWDDAILFGCPMLANSTSAVFDPVNLLTAVLPPRYSWGAGIPIRPLLAGTAVALLVNALGGTVSGSWLAGIVFAFSGFLSSWRGRTQESSGIWLPVAFLAVDRLWRRRDRGAVFLAAAAGALPILGGHPEVAFQMAIAVVAFALHRLMAPPPDAAPQRRVRGRQRASFAGLLVLAGIGAVALCLVQLGPTFEWIARLERSLQGSWGHLPLRDIATFVSRNKLADPNSDGYAGMITLLLVPFAVLHRNRRDAIFFMLLLAVAIEIPFGLPPFYGLSQRAPILGGLPNARVLLEADFALAVLAGLGLSALEQGESRTRARLPALLVAAAVALLAAWAVFPRNDAPTDGGEAHRLVRSWASEGWIGLAVVGVGLVAVGKLPRSYRGRAALLVATIDLFTYQHGRLRFVRPDQVFPPAPVLDFLRSRVRDGARVATMNVTMGSNFEMMYGLKSPGGYDFRLRRTDRILAPLSAPRGHALMAAAVASSPPHGIFDLLGARYLLATTWNSSSSDLERFPKRFSLIFRDHSVRVFEDTSALPRAFFLPATAIRHYPGEEQEADAVLSPAFDARRILVVAGAPETGEAPPLIGNTPLVPAEDFDESPGRVSFALDAPASGFVVVSQSAYPGWRARVDGRTAALIRADYAFQAVAVGPGRHRVLLYYDPPLFWACLFASAAGWLGLVVWTLGRIARPRSGAPG